MKKYQVLVTLRDGVKDIAGEAIKKGANNLPKVQQKVKDLSIGKVIYLTCEDDLDISMLCESLLANTVIEKYEINQLK